jgi:L-ascorbate metabolism protein UlaG (beta-lactamase superfamily)
MDEINRNDRSNRKPQRLPLSGDCFLTACSTSPNFIPASFKIDTPREVIYIDPYQINDTAPADYIFITHPHPDHLSLPDIARVVKKDTRIICPQRFVKQLSGYNLQKVKPGDGLDLGDLQCDVVPAYNRWFPAHLKLLNFVGYILTIHGIRLYHAGDTDFIPEMKGFRNITVAMVPIGKGRLAMNPVQAAAAINVIKPSIAVPMHYETEKNNAEKFKQLVDKNIQVVVMQG